MRITYSGLKAALPVAQRFPKRPLVAFFPVSHGFISRVEAIIICGFKNQLILIDFILKGYLQFNFSSRFRAEMQNLFGATRFSHIIIKSAFPDGMQKKNTPIKLDFPDPLGPMMRFMGPSDNFSTEAMLLNPFMVMKSSSGFAICLNPSYGSYHLRFGFF